jgi:hypothetical protein
MPLWYAHSKLQRNFRKPLLRISGVSQAVSSKTGEVQCAGPGRMVLFRSVTGLLLSMDGNSKQAGGPGHLARPCQENRYRMSGKTTIIQRALI